jgi:tetratricopeptide (TPR) repeat protein
MPNCLGWLYLEAFDYENAISLTVESRDLARRIGLLEPEANAEINLGIASLEIGNLDAAADSFRRTEDIFARDNWMRWRYQQRLELGWSEYHRRRGDLDAARQHATKCVELAQGTSGGKHLVLARAQLAKIALDRGEIEQAEPMLRAADDELQDITGALAAWRVHDTWGRFHRDAGQEEMALKHERQALEVLSAMAGAAPREMRESLRRSEVFQRLERSVRG